MGIASEEFRLISHHFVARLICGKDIWLLVLSNPHLIDFLKSMTLRSGLIEYRGWCVLIDMVAKPLLRQWSDTSETPQGIANTD